MTPPIAANIFLAHYGNKVRRQTIGAQDVTWKAEAECADMDTALFFPGRGHWVDPQARDACARCPVRRQCLDYALAANEREGIWGGKTPDQRKGIKRSRRFRERMKEKAG